jgi:transcriptional regulator with XRE-family HTH domain
VSQIDAFSAAGGKIRALREAKELSQERLSFDAEIDQSTLSKVERMGPMS